MALTSRDRFEVLKAVLAMAEEQGGIALGDASAELGIDRETLLSILSPLLHLSFRAQTNDEMIDTTYSFELDEDSDRLSVDQAHWLRDMRSVPPSPATAQRLALAALVVKSAALEPDPTLGAALAKLEDLTGDLVVVIPEPPFIETVRACTEEETPLRFTYAKSADDVSERTIDPYKVFRQAGTWYVAGRDHRDDAIKYFRIDRMLDAEMTRLARFTPPDEVDVPERMPIDHLLQHVRVRVPERLRNLLTDDYSVDDLVDLHDGRIEVTVGVLGDERLDYLLLRLGGEAEWLDDSLTARRAAAARALLEVYDA